MISFEEALAILSEHAFPVGTINVPLQDALGCTLAEPVISPADLPYFDNSAVDGYGILSADSNTASPESPIPLELLATVPAGESSLKTVTSGTAVKILTGAPVPSGVEAVIMQEFTEQDNGTVFLKRSVKPGENIRYKGEELRQGDIVLSAGTAVNPAVIGLLASLGYTTIKVFRKPKVALIITGNELVPPGEALQPGQIYESNSYSLVAALATMGILEVTVSQVKDNREATEQVLQKALEDADVVITSGGVSVGEFDLVKDVFTACNIQPHFWQVAIKPGKPVFFGMYQAG